MELLTPTDDEDATCDRCRHRANPIHVGATAIGSILLGYGLCTRCLHTTGLDQAEDTHP